MNADRTIYGRYGSRSSVDDAAKDMSVSGLAETMTAVLRIHEQYPDNRAELAGKQAVATEFKSPNDFPSLRGKFKDALDYDGAVSQSCMHCHQVRDAHRQIYRSAGESIPDELLFPHPAPRVVGLSMDPSRATTISEVRAGSAADQAGIEAGDVVQSMDGQAILSRADIEWVLHNAAATDEVAVIVQRGDRRLALTITLETGWRRNTDISWRVSSWPLRRMGTGGLLFRDASAEERQLAKVADGSLALVVEHVGQYGAHAAAKRAGFKKGDLVVSFNGRTSRMTTSQLLAFATQPTKPRERVPVIVVRDGQRLELTLPMQE